jgi:transcriptional regulator with XRE-family HTH domain
MGSQLAFDDFTGLDLRLLRVSRRLTVQAVAATIGVSPSRISQIERSRHVDRRQTDRYVRAILTATVAQ